MVVALPLGLESGIVLTTGDVGFADAANTADDSGGDASGAGDEDLDAALALETMTSDATVLEFTFETENQRFVLQLHLRFGRVQRACERRG